MKRPKLSWLVAALLAVGVASEVRYYFGQESLLFSEERLAVEVLEDSTAPVRDRFNHGADRWRMLAILSPMAPVSTAGVDSLLEDLLLEAPELPLDLSVVFFHGLPWDHRGKARTRPRWSVEKRWRFYWDPDDLVAREVLAGLHPEWSRLEGRYLIYPPRVVWPAGEEAPTPLLELSGSGVSGLREGRFAEELSDLRQLIESESAEPP